MVLQGSDKVMKEIKNFYREFYASTGDTEDEQFWFLSPTH